MTVVVMIVVADTSKWSNCPTGWHMSSLEANLSHIVCLAWLGFFYRFFLIGIIALVVSKNSCVHFFTDFNLQKNFPTLKHLFYILTYFYKTKIHKTFSGWSCRRTSVDIVPSHKFITLKKKLFINTIFNYGLDNY